MGVKMLGMESFIHYDACATFLKECESTSIGGFQKFPEVKQPDLLHSYFSVCGLSLCGILPPLNPLLGCSERAFEAGRTGKGYFRRAKGAKSWSPPQALF